MMYSRLIVEDIQCLLKFEKSQRSAVNRNRIRFLRLLKTGQSKTQISAGEVIGIGQRHSQRLWHIYRQGGLHALITKPSCHSLGKLTNEQVICLKQFLVGSKKRTLRDIQRYLLKHLGVEYTIGGVHALCKRLAN